MATVRKMFGDVVGKLFFREVAIAGIHEVSRRFRRIDLVGSSLEGVPFTAGDKVQVMLEGGLRTYTPFAFDSARGKMSFLVYVHGDSTSPGARWGKRVAVGEQLHVFGPRRSLVAEPSRPLVLFGDETSFAVARAMRDRGDRCSCVFEVSDREESRLALEHLRLEGEALIERRADDGHLAEVETSMRSAIVPTTQLLFTGRAQSIQSLRRALKSKPIEHGGEKVKAYWAPGKRGLD